MKQAICKLSSASEYSQSRPYQTEKLSKELPKDYEERTWKDRLHLDKKDPTMVIIPPMVFKNCLSECAKFRSIQIPGKGKATYTKHFEAGVQVTEPMHINIKAADVEGEWVFVPVTGRRGDGSRVYKKFPLILQWSGEITFYVMDETITEDVFREHLEEAGRFIGIGRFRPRNNGYYGRFNVDDIQWSDLGNIGQVAA